MKVKLISHTMDIEKVVALGAKVCYSGKSMDELLSMTDDIEKNIEMVDKLLEWGHESPIEHASFTFMVEDVSRSLTHQLVRHRIASYSQRSQRYVDESNFNFVIPERILKSPEAKHKYLLYMDTIGDCYEGLIQELIMSSFKEQQPDLYDRILYKIGSNNSFLVIRELEQHHSKLYTKLKKEVIEDARYILPNACSTTIVFTMNLRSLKHFFGLRLCDRSQHEIRIMAKRMREECIKVSPLFKMLAQPNCIQLGYCPESNKSCGKIPTLELIKRGE